MIKRIFNKDVDFTKLRLHSSECNRARHLLFKEFKNNIRETDIRYYPNTSNIYEKLRKWYNHEHLIMGFGSDRCIKYFFEVNKK